MKVSVVIRSLNEADRLRLVLTSLARQSLAAQVVVVDDGSTDHTPDVIAEAPLPLTCIRHTEPHGRSAASNAGALAATGEVLLFLDGDTLAAPDLVALHAALHAERKKVGGRGETFHLRQTRFLLDPETASAKPGEEARLNAMPPGEREGLKITRRQILEDFGAIDRRASPGIYPGAGPRKLHELEIAALRDHPECDVLWTAAVGANFSVKREAFLEAGGFDAEITINEHRELALRLQRMGHKVALAAGARSYHMTHRTGWRDPLKDDLAWERMFHARHPIAAVKLLSVLWASLADDARVPPAARILSLPALEEAARGENGVDYDQVRRDLGLPALGDSSLVSVAPSLLLRAARR